LGWDNGYYPHSTFFQSHLGAKGSLHKSFVRKSGVEKIDLALKKEDNRR